MTEFVTPSTHREPAGHLLHGGHEEDVPKIAGFPRAVTDLAHWLEGPLPPGAHPVSSQDFPPS